MRVCLRAGRGAQRGVGAAQGRLKPPLPRRGAAGARSPLTATASLAPQLVLPRPAPQTMATCACSARDAQIAGCWRQRCTGAECVTPSVLVTRASLTTHEVAHEPQDGPSRQSSRARRPAAEGMARAHARGGSGSGSARGGPRRRRRLARAGLDAAERVRACREPSAVPRIPGATLVGWEGAEAGARGETRKVNQGRCHARSRARGVPCSGGAFPTIRRPDQ
jgi:hypothetical protein